ncbi:MAG: ABC transporter substrate-binding protein [Acetobacteraceae bacterium]
MRRRVFLGAGVGALAAPALVRAAAETTLKFVPYADLALLDPAVSAFVTRNHVLMVFDTLFGVDETGVAQPQMLEGYTTSADGLAWTLTLRDGLRFHDGTPVLARDAVASIKRWWVNDSFGQALAASTDEVAATDDRTIRFRLKRRFHLLPDALGHPTNTMAAIMPERLAATPASSRLTEMVGSGPFRYVAGERVPGARNVYAKFEGYVPRAGAASFTAGPRVVHFDRVEWLTTPDPATQIAALKAGEVDFVEQPLMDLVPSLASNPAIKVEVVETRGLIGFLRFNQTFPPFDNPRIRRAVLQAVVQREFMEAVVGGAAPFDAQCGLFTTGTPLANDAGMTALSGTHDLVALRQEIKAAGYTGEKIVYLEPTDVPRINAIAEVGADMLRKLGMNVDVIATDWGTTVQRSVSRQPPDKGGWHMFAAFSGGWDMSSPGSHQLMRGNGPNAYNGWPTLPELEGLRDAFLAAEDRPTQLALARQMQERAMQDVPYLPLGSYYQPVAYKANLTGVPKGLVQFTGIRRL